MFLLDTEDIRIDREYLMKLEEKKDKLFRILVYEKKYNNLKLFRTYLKSLLRLQDLMNIKSAQFEAQDKPTAELYYKNLLKAYDFIIDEVLENRTIKDQKSLIYLHHLIDPEAHARCAGRTRNSTIMVGNHTPPEPNRIYSLLENMFYNGAEIQNPIIKGIYLHHEIVRIHPFHDGNGRLARLVENWVFMLALYPPIVISALKDRQVYIRDLDRSFTELENEESGSTTTFFNNQMKRLNNSLDYLYTRLKL